MSLQENSPPVTISSLLQQTGLRRWMLLLIVAGIFLVMGFYAVSDGSYLQHDHILDGTDWTGYALCHRITERSFTINGRQFPLCARCSGMYLGVALVFIILALAGRMRRALLPPLPLLLILFAFIAIMGIDGLNSYSHFFPNAPHLYEPRNWLRLLTGMGTGVAMGLILMPALAQTLWRSPQFLPVIETRRELVELLVAAGLLVFLLLSNLSPLLYVLALVSVAGLLFIVTALNAVILMILLRKDGRANFWKEAVIPLLAGFLLAVIQISAISAVRFNLTGTMTGFPGL
jgi:uncharacterized membrane protein